MKLEFKDRLTVVYGELLPRSASLSKMKMAKAIKEKVDFSEEEKTNLNLKTLSNGAIQYATASLLESFSKNVEFADEELSMLKEGAQLLDANEQVTEDSLPTIIKFIECS